MNRVTLSVVLFVLVAVLATATVQAQDTVLARPTLSAHYSNDAVHLQWDAIDGAVEYDLWVWVTEWVHVTKTSSTNHIHSSVTLGQKHWYALQALNSANEGSEWSDYVEVDVPQIQVTATATPEATPTPTAQTQNVQTPEQVNLSAEFRDGAVHLKWGVDSNATEYEIWVWVTEWKFVANTNLTTYAHSDLVFGVTHWYAARALNSAGDEGPWSSNVEVAVPSITSTPTPTATSSITPTNTPTPQPTDSVLSSPRQPPAFLESEIIYKHWCINEYTCTKYLKAPGVHVVATDDFTDKEVQQTVEVITDIISDRPNLVVKMDGYTTMALLVPLPEGGGQGGLGIAIVSRTTDVTFFCHILTHEMAHVIHATKEGRNVGWNEQPTGTEFDRRLRNAYQNALDNGLWDKMYASKNFLEYWADTTTFWLRGHIPDLAIEDPIIVFPPIKEYDPTITSLIEDTLGDASVPEYCQHPSQSASALDLYDDNNDGRITCAEARRHEIAPVHRDHPAYPYMDDRDNDGVVCE